MNALFADSFYWIALLNPADAAHDRAMDFSRDYAGICVTTQSVLTEVLNACSTRARRMQAASLVRMLRSQEDVVIESTTDELFDRGLAIYEARPDKSWSLTDCISFAVMMNLEIMEALTGDHHFEQAGFVALLK